VNIQLIKALEIEKSVLRQLLELYAYDFSEFDGADVNDHGYYGYTFLDHYWTEESRHPFFIRVDGCLAGFVLISSYTYILPLGNAKSITEFFVMRKYRRMGIGSIVAVEVFDQFPGKWEVIQHEDNHVSKRFWAAVIQKYTHGKFRMEKVKTEYWDGQAFIFDNATKS
jgi:predicted acetyltransferase